MKGKQVLNLTLAVASVAVLTVGSASAAKPAPKVPTPVWTENVAFDISAPLRSMVDAPGLASTVDDPDAEPLDFRPEEAEHEREIADHGFSGDDAVSGVGSSAAISGPLVNFEGMSNRDNFNTFGFRVNPPDTVGDVGPNHYVEMVNLVYAVYDKAGNKLVGPVNTGTLWAGFAIPDCTDASGDPVVLYDQLADRWILSQFTTRGVNNSVPNYNCVAVSVTGDPTGAYYRYAFTSGLYFPDYPKYGVWTDSYFMTTRDFGPNFGYGISIYALEKNKMIAGLPKARAVQYFLNSDVIPLALMGDGILPPDVDGSRRPAAQISAPFIGTQDDGAGYGATSDAINIWELKVLWNSKPVSSLSFAAQLPVASFDSVFPCTPTTRKCLPQPGATASQKLDVQSYRQRPIHRQAYRNQGKYDSFLASQSVEAAAGVAGVRWYEVRRVNGVYSVFQQGTINPNDGVHRWMGSVAMDWQGNIAAGYSVVNGTSVYPGIRYTGRLAGDPLGQMTLGEATIINGTGIQRSINNRWGDYTSMNVDPTDDCTFWYANEYYTLAGQASSTAGWQTRIASFKLPGCVARAP